MFKSELNQRKPRVEHGRKTIILNGNQVFEKSTRRGQLGFDKNAERGTGHEKRKKNDDNARCESL